MQIRLLQPLPTGLPKITLPNFSATTLLDLLPSALFDRTNRFISSSTISAQQARIRGESYDANKELGGLGLEEYHQRPLWWFCGLRGISRTSLNLSVGAKTPLASIICALGVLLILLVFGQYLTGLPYAILAAVIISSVISMIDTKTLINAWQLDKSDAICFGITFSPQFFSV